MIATHSAYVVSRPNDDGTVSILHVERIGEVIQLDGIVAKMWLLLDGKRTLEEVYDLLVRTESPPRRRFRRDFDWAVGEMARLNLIQTA